MRGNEMLEAVGYIEPVLIEKGEKSGKRTRWKQWTAVAASICLILGGAFLYHHSMPQYASEILSVSKTDIGMGYEGYRAFAISELLTANPTDGSRLRALNVYRNTVSYDDRLYPYGQDLEGMKAYLLTLADKFGLDTGSLEILDNAPGEGQMQGLIAEFAGMGREVPDYYKLPYTVYVQTEEVQIEVSADMTATIRFTNGIPLPEKYHFAYTSTPEELTAIGEYLWSMYGGLIGYENPQMRITGGDYSTDGTQSYDLAFYDGKRDKIENFENYSFNYTEFAPNSEGKLWLIRIYNDTAMEKIGLYPLISEEEAKALLLDGQYYTSVMEDFPGEDAVVRCELIYCTGGKGKILMPFYRFYVLLEDAPGAHLYPDGIHTYGAYYVPAVDPAYLT